MANKNFMKFKYVSIYDILLEHTMLTLFRIIYGCFHVLMEVK